MFAAYCRLAGIVLMILALAACTRARPVPPPTVLPDTAAITERETPTPASISASQPAEGEPEVILEATATIQSSSTPVRSEDETFQYTVQPGDTLSTIAEQFGTDMETIRRLNRLSSDDLFVGQPLYVPYVEGMTAAGLPTPTPGPYYYTIQSGDTLGLIAQQFEVDQIQIIESNNLLDPDNLTVGATILIPGYQPSGDPVVAEEEAESSDVPSSTGGRVVHSVRPGEGLYQIAERYGVDATEIAAANGITLQDLLNVGQELIIPGITEEEAILARSITHVVQSGENLFGIAVRYGVTVEELLEANDITDPDTISIGQRLLIPAE